MLDESFRAVPGGGGAFHGRFRCINLQGAGAERGAAPAHGPGGPVVWRVSGPDACAGLFGGRAVQGRHHSSGPLDCLWPAGCDWGQHGPGGPLRGRGGSGRLPVPKGHAAPGPGHKHRRPGRGGGLCVPQREHCRGGRVHWGRDLPALRGGDEGGQPVWGQV